MKRLSFVLIGIVFILGSCTLTKTLVYQKVNIHDYKIFKNRAITADKHQVWGEAVNYNKYVISEEQRKEIEEIETVAYLVVKDHKIIYEEYWDDYNKDSYSNSFSMAKSFVSLLIGFAIDEGKIKSVDQKVSDFIPEYKKDGRDKITIKHVLQMSSGLYWGESYSSPFSRTARAYYGKNLYRIVKNLELREEPGKTFSYSSGDTQILAFIVEQATGKTLSEYASEKLWKPLGAKHDALWCLDKKNGHEKAYCCFNSNARDFARIGQFILQMGVWNDERLISEEYLLHSLTPAEELKYKEQTVDFYGYQWWIMKHKGMNIKYARGLLGQYIFIIPEKNMIVVRLGHHRSSEYQNGIPKDIPMWVDIALGMVE